MDKHIWKQVKTLSSQSHRPSSRWGHSSCVVGQQIVFFGGYADSNYMNDIWTFNSKTMTWKQITTTGDIPIQRSNCTMNYDKQNNQIIIFGGGGANKQRFNSISVLDWNTKNWIQISPKQNQISPWERTYHAAQFFFPYLIVYGGQGVADLDDLWLFNFQTLSWTQVKTNADKPKPCARRFHSSVMIGNEFMVIAGCHSKYRCLSDIYSIDFTSLIKTGKIDQLEWQQKKIKNSSFLTRWGHSSAVYDNKIYIFGGRFSNDLNDLLVVDFETNSIRTIKTNPQAPPARRRHCSGFIGSSMLVFGGFNGQYFQDLHYISVHQAKSKIQISITEDQKKVLSYLNNQRTADYMIQSNQNQRLYFNLGMIAKYFFNIEKMYQFLKQINNQCTFENLYSIFTILYKGYGQLSPQITKYFSQNFPQNKSQKIAFEKEKIQKINCQQNIKQAQKFLKKATANQSPIIKLKQDQFTQYFIQRKFRNFYDQQLRFGNDNFEINRISLILKSQYFNSLFTSNNAQIIQIPQILSSDNKVVYEMFFNYLQTSFLVINDNISAQTFINLATISDYFCINSLIQICCNQLMNMISFQNVQKMLNFALGMKMNNLSKACCDFWIKKSFQNVKLSDLQLQIQIRKTFDSKNKNIFSNIIKIYQKIRFDLNQTYMQDDKRFNMKKKNTSNSVEKQNSENNIQQHHLNY